MWLTAHVFFLIGFRNRLIVLLNWAWAYLTYQRHARIVLEREARADTGAAAAPDGGKSERPGFPGRPP